MIVTERISRFRTYLPRHRPKEYPLVFDEQGFVAWSDVVETVQERFQEVTEDEIHAVATDSYKKRFGLRETRVRATYGHSFPVKLASGPVEPPPRLFYGTTRDLAPSMVGNRLRPRDRQYVHFERSIRRGAGCGTEA